jgi:hypothetical protein
MIDPARLVEHVHGHAGWLAVAALLHPTILLRDSRRRADLSVVLAVAFVTSVGAAGVWLYGEYRDRIKQQIFIHAPTIGYLFERKEHLAFGAILLAWTGTIAYFGARSAEGATLRALRRTAFYAFAASFVLALASAVLGTIVASYKTF